MAEFTRLVQIRPGHYRCILADPPWRFRSWSAKGEGRNPIRHYQCMDTEMIAGMPIAAFAARDCALFLWATAPMLPDAFRVMEAWGFRFSTAGGWVKTTRDGSELAFGTGMIWRSALEFLLIGSRGSPRWLTRTERNVIEAPRREHSRKPDEVYRLIEAMAPGPKIELFGRRRRKGWDVWGNEVGKFGDQGSGIGDLS